jgi:hypothetical protein
MMLANKYGKDFVAAAAELMPDCGVNRQVIWHTNLEVFNHVIWYFEGY